MKTHFLALIPIVVKVWVRKYGCAVRVGSVLCTSINYWRRPERGPRRNMDIAAVFSVGLYNMYRCPRVWCFAGPMCCGTWILSNYLDSHAVHSMVHVIAVSAYLIEEKII